MTSGGTTQTATSAGTMGTATSTGAAQPSGTNTAGSTGSNLNGAMSLNSFPLGGSIALVAAAALGAFLV